MTWNKLPKNFGKTHNAGMDALDREAEAEGNAIGRYRREYQVASPVGRRIVKNSNKESRGGCIVANRKVAAFKTDHKTAQDKYMV